ncbi:MAG: alpha-L-fucosidase, partial [Candidatus Omnitrophota bacterium]
MKRLFLLIAFILIGLSPLIGNTEPNSPLPLCPPLPTAQQLAWQGLEYIAFAHFGVNTFTDREWGEGTEDPAIFNPTEFDAHQWVKTLQDAGMKLLILTAKHHDGFCLWPSQYTEHCVKNTPWRGGKGDVVREISDACREGGVKLGIYLSPWDRHEPSYGDSPVYNEHFKNQLRELLSNYGDIAEVWFDGACGEGPNGKKQVYDFEGYYKVIRELQPNAVIAIMGPDVRWVGNESGVARETEWSVQTVSPESNSQAHTGVNPASFNKTVVTGSWRFLSDKPHEEGPLAWYPAECDVSIRPGWFYHAKEDNKVKSLEQLLDIYYQSVGRNSVLLLNLPPDRRGLIHENDAARLRELRRVLDDTFKTDLALHGSAAADNVRGYDSQYGPACAVDGLSGTYWAADDGVMAAQLVFDLHAKKTFDVAMLQEPVWLGQRIAEFKLEAETKDGWKEIAQGTTIGYKRLMRFPAVSASRVRLKILQSRACPAINNF